VEAMIDRGLAAVTRPSNLALFLGGQALCRMVGEGGILSQLTFASEKIHFSTRWRWAAAAILPLAAVSCGGQSGAQEAVEVFDASPPPDGGQRPVDQDSDGYSRDLDCNDGDPKTHPLPAAGGVVTINSSRTICPGTYQNVQIVIPSGTTGIHLTGTGVTLDGKGSTQYAIQMDGVNQTTVEGFTIRNYNADPGNVYLNNSHDNTFRHMTVEPSAGLWAFYLTGSNRNLFQDLHIKSYCDRGIQILDSDQATVRDSAFTRMPPYDGLPWYGLLTFDGGTGHWIENNLFESGLNNGLQLYNLSDATVLNNQMLSNGADGIQASYMRNSRIEANHVNSNQGSGLNLKNGSIGNMILNNDFTANVVGPVTTDTSSATGNSFSGNTPPP
jgi:parallel beta helix pectate lyase-like protein